MAEQSYKNVREKVSALLQRYRSEESRRAGRNASILSATVIAVHVLKLNLSDVSAFGLKVPVDGVATAKWLLAALLAYFVATFLLYIYRDRQIQEDRKRIALDYREAAKQRLVYIAKKEQEHGGTIAHYSVDKSYLTQMLKESDSHASATRWARISDTIALASEIGVPLLLAVAAFAILAL